MRIKYSIISAFPGTGKSHAVNNNTKPELVLFDSDSSLFPRDNGAFPSNYIHHIKTLCSDIQSHHNEYKRAGIFISSHQNVRASLVTENIPFHLVYPVPSLKEEYMDRYYKRGSPDSFLKFMEDSWESLIESCMSQVGCIHHQFEKPDDYLDNLIKQIL